MTTIQQNKKNSLFEIIQLKRILKNKLNYFTAMVVMGMMCLSSFARAEDVLSIYKTDMRKMNVNFQDFSEIEGKKLFYLERVNKSGEKVSCTVCHTKDPKGVGQTRAGKRIKPLAPVVNPERFTDLAQVEKWFRRNCKDVLERECSLEEKGNFIKYMNSIK